MPGDSQNENLREDFARCAIFAPLMPKRLLLLLCLLVLAGGLTAAWLMHTTSPRQHAEVVLRTVGPEHLRDAAAGLYKDMFASIAPDYTAMKEAMWPPQFSAFKPDHVGAYRDGFALSLVSGHGLESGIYVIPAHSDFQPRATAHARFERMADGVYWYSFDQ
jgi:hypothetical protein